MKGWLCGIGIRSLLRLKCNRLRRTWFLISILNDFKSYNFLLIQITSYQSQSIKLLERKYQSNLQLKNHNFTFRL